MTKPLNLTKKPRILSPNPVFTGFFFLIMSFICVKCILMSVHTMRKLDIQIISTMIQVK